MTALIVVAAAIFSVPVALIVFNGILALYARSKVPAVGRFIDLDGVRLHYVDEGSGPAVLMIHGLSSQLQTYTYAMAGLLRPRYRLIIVDRPGSGYSQAAASATLGAQAALMSGLLRALDVDRALVVGHSLGGAVALALALDHPEQVAGLVLLAPATQPQKSAPGSLSRLAIRYDVTRWVLSWTIATPLAMRHGQAILANLFAPNTVRSAFGTRAGSLLSLRPANFRNASRDMVEAGGQLGAYAARYGSITVPTGVLFGKGDRILDYREHGLALEHQIPRIEVELIEVGGHMTPISSPERSAAMVERIAERAGLIEPVLPS